MKSLDIVLLLLSIVGTLWWGLLADVDEDTGEIQWSWLIGRVLFVTAIVAAGLLLARKMRIPEQGEGR